MMNAALLGGVSAPASVDPLLLPQELLEVAVAVFALVLLVLSMSAYRKTRLDSLLVVSLGFGMFAVEVVLRQLNEFVFRFGTQANDIITTSMEFVILLLFFVAIVAKK